MKKELYLHLTPSTHSNSHGRTRHSPNRRTPQDWRRALEGHTLTAHGKAGLTVEDCQACIDLKQKASEL